MLANQSVKKKKKVKPDPEFYLPEPVVCGGNGRHGHAQTQRRHLGAVQKVGTKEPNGHKHVEQVDKDTSNNLRCVVLGAKGGGHSHGNHAASHTRTRNHEDGATTEAINGEEGDEGREELPGQGTSSKSASVL